MARRQPSKPDSKDSTNQKHFETSIERRPAHNLVTSETIRDLMAIREGMTPLPHMYSEDEGESSPAVVMTRTKPKSRSIKIKQPRRSYNKQNEEDQIYSTYDESEQRMYDWATWRMYDRITTFRRSRAAVVPVPHPEPFAPAMHRLPVPTMTDHHESIYHPRPITPDGSSSVDEGMFALDF